VNKGLTIPAKLENMTCIQIKQQELFEEELLKLRLCLINKVNNKIADILKHIFKTLELTLVRLGKALLRRSLKSITRERERVCVYEKDIIECERVSVFVRERERES